MSLTPHPTPTPSRSQDQAAFNSAVAAHFGWLPTHVSELNALQADVAAKQSAAAVSEAAAAASANTAIAQAAVATARAADAASLAGAPTWASGTYALDAPAVSQSNQQLYRCKVAGLRTIDPANDPTNWTRVIVGAGAGGQVQAPGSVVLTYASGAAQVVTPTGFGQSITLPNATTLPLAGFAYSFVNNSPYPVKVQDYTGAAIGFIGGFDCGDVALASNVTAAGIWNAFDLLPFDVTAKYASTTLANISSVSVVQVDYARTGFVFTSSNNVYAIVHDSASGLWGAPTLVRAGTALVAKAILAAANQVLVGSVPNNSTAFEAVTLTMSGTAVTVNTAVTATLTAASGGMTDVLQVGTSFVFGHTLFPAGTPKFLAVSISGTVPTVGTESAPTGTSAAQYFATSGGLLLVVSATASSGVWARPYTLSGVSFAAGTEVAITSNSINNGTFRTFVFGTRWGLVFKGTSDLVSTAVISVAGSVATASVLQNVLSGATGGINVSDVAIYGNKFLVASPEAGGVVFNTVTDTSGTASAGTPLTLSAYSTAGYTTLLQQVGAMATYFVPLGSYYRAAISIDMAGASPVLSAQTSVGHTSGDAAIFAPKPLSGEANGYAIGNTVRYTLPTGGDRVLAYASGSLVSYPAPGRMVNGALCKSIATSVNWAFSGAGMVQIQKIEAVA